MRMADRYIINKCLNGDSTAFGMLVDKYKESVYALAYSKLRNFHDAEDVTQEAFMKAYQKLRTLRQWDDFHAWIYSITNNICKMMIRSRSRQPDREYIEDQDVKSLHIEKSDYESPMIETLHEALDSLPETYQQVLTLHYLGGMDGTEIAEFLGMSPTSIWQRLSRARSLLRKEMLDMMSETFEQNRLKAGFTFCMVEMVKGMRLNPISPKALPWGFSLATGIIMAVLSIGTHLNITNPTDSLSGSPLPGESKVLRFGEYPVDVIKVSNISVLTNQRWNGTGLGSIVLSLQNALFMVPQVEGGTWTKKADMPTARNSFSTSVVDGKIYAIGGWSEDNDTVLATVEEYDPITDIWVKKAVMPIAKSCSGSGVINNRIYVIGGSTPNGQLSVVEEYDPIADKWTRKADMPNPRDCCVGTLNGKIYAIGGSIEFDPVTAVEEYDPVKDSWKKKADILTKRSSLAVCAVNGKIYTIGGVLFDGGFRLFTTLEEYDPMNDKWTKKSDMPTPRHSLSTCIANGKIYAIGGAGMSGPISTVEEYDPAIDRWTKKAEMSTIRSHFSASEVNGKIYAIGGWKPNMDLPTVEEYDPGTGQSINFKGKLPTTWGDMKLAQNKQ
jgi:RNA polymerase sigma factor (sigma-70 family)